MITDEQFEKLLEHYQGSFIQWHRHITKFMKIDREAFYSDFQMILFRTMRRFDVAKSTAEDARFERYFQSSLRKMCNSLLREANSKKYGARKKSISLCLKKHDISDGSFESQFHEMIVRDIIASHLKRRERVVLNMLVSGYNGGEICRLLHLSHPDYRRYLRKIRNNDRLVEAVSSI